MAEKIELIVGLGNPGEQYKSTRHNAGFWYVCSLLSWCGGTLKPERKFHASIARINIAGRPVWLLLPSTYMNKSGLAVAAFAGFYKISPQSILVAHDELDIPAGQAKIKQGGGHGGHNGLRDIISSLGNDRDFHRLRIGIGHPGNSREVHNYVLSKPPVAEKKRIDETIDQALHITGHCIEGQWQDAMQQLHTFRAS